MPMIAKDKPELRNDICSAQQRADISFYDDGMQLLVYKNIQKALKEIYRLWISAISGFVGFMADGIYQGRQTEVALMLIKRAELYGFVGGVRAMKVL